MDKGKILYNVKKVIVTPIDEATGLPKVGAVKINITTAEEVEISAKYSEGEEKVLRVDNDILATATTDDILIAYEIKLKDNTFNMNILELLEGGTITYDDVDTTQIVGYESPMLADKKTSKPFVLEMYVAEYEGQQIKQYVKITFPYCKGKTPSLSFKKDFYAPDFEIKAQENTTASLPIKKFEFVATIPASV